MSEADLGDLAKRFRPLVEATSTGPGPERGERKSTDEDVLRLVAFTTYRELKKERGRGGRLDQDDQERLEKAREKFVSLIPEGEDPEATIAEWEKAWDRAERMISREK